MLIKNIIKVVKSEVVKLMPELRVEAQLDYQSDEEVRHRLNFYHDWDERVIGLLTEIPLDTVGKVNGSRARLIARCVVNAFKNYEACPAT